MLGTILKITSFPDTHSKDCLIGDEDPKDTLLKARFDRLFLNFVRRSYESKNGERR